MPLESPVELYSSAALADAAAFSLNGGEYISAIDHTYEPAGGASRHPVERTMWRLWRSQPAGAGGTIQRLADAMIPLPTAQAIAISANGNSLAAVVEANNVTAAWLLRWDLPSGVEGLGSAKVQTVPLRLDTSQVAQVSLPPGTDWSSPFLPCPLWMFHASAAVAETGHVLAALNSADAHAVLFEHAPGEAAAKSTAFLPEALEPRCAIGGNARMLYYRKPTSNWSVYLHDVMISGKYGPVALPLVAAELNAGGGVGPPRTLPPGDVFAFAVHQVGVRTLLAAVTGSKTQPRLQVCVAETPGGEFQPKRSIALARVPFRVSMTADGERILVALGFQGDGGGYRVEAVQLRGV